MLVVRDARAFSYREQKRTFPFGLSAGEGRRRYVVAEGDVAAQRRHSPRTRLPCLIVNLVNRPPLVASVNTLRAFWRLPA